MKTRSLRDRCFRLGLATTLVAVTTSTVVVEAGGANAAVDTRPASLTVAKPVLVVPSGEAGPANPTTGELPEPQPTIGPAALAAMKDAAARSARSGQTRPASPTAALVPPPPLVLGPAFPGTDQNLACNCWPPDTHGTVGLDHYVQVVNSKINMYTKPTQTLAKTVSLNSFFGYTGAGSTLLFDSRAQYDAPWGRYVIIAEGFPQPSGGPNPGCQYFFVGVSATADPLGAWFISRMIINGCNPGRFFDYPQLGMDSHTLLVTANVFGGGNVGSAYFLKKVDFYQFYTPPPARIVWYYPGLSPSTIASTMVLDHNAATYEISAPPAGSTITKYAFANTDADPPTLNTVTNVSVPAFSSPPSANQPITTAKLDTLDARFVNSSTQIGNSIYNVHTINSFGLPTPKWYEFTGTGSGVVGSGMFFASPSSNDWNASIAVNYAREKFVTWSSTDNTRAGPVFPEERVSVAPAGNNPSAGAPTFTSSTFYVNRRWGDYSSTSLDPSPSTSPACAANRRAWVDNEVVLSTPPTPTKWATEIARFGFC